MVDVANNGEWVIKTVDSETQLTLHEVLPGTLTNLSFDVWTSGISILANSKGTWGERLKVTASANLASRTNFDLEVSLDGATVEKFHGLDRSALVISSQYITATIPAGVSTNPSPGSNQTLQGGIDGDSGLTDADYIGTADASATKGLQVFRNPDTMELSCLAVPGISSEAVTNEVVDVAEFRGDCIGLIDVPDSGTVSSATDALDYSNGLLTRTSAINSRQVAVYWSWVKVYDEYNAADAWCPPCGAAASAFALTDSASAEWFAPAGPRRGKVRAASGVRYSPNKTERDLMLAPGQCVNPIINVVNKGVHIWGQKTALRTSSALNRLNVRRMLNYVERIVAQSTQSLLFEPNDGTTRRQFIDLVKPILQYVLARRGIQDFKIVCDETNNPAIVVDNNQLHATMYIRPTKAAEILVISSVLTSQGADFNELIQAAA